MASDRDGLRRIGGLNRIHFPTLVRRAERDELMDTGDRKRGPRPPKPRLNIVV